MPVKRAPRHPVPAPPASTVASTAGVAAQPPEHAATVRDSEPDPPDAYRRRPRQSRGQKRVELLLDAAATVIARAGLEAATAEAIALEARTAKGSLYQFFPNRDAVLAALALRYADEMRAIHERTFPIDSRGLALERLIDRIIKPLADFHDRHPAFRRVFAHHEGPHDETRSAPSRLRIQLFESFVDRLDVLFAARNPRLGSRERRRAALIAATIGQSILARRARAAATEKKPLLDDLRRVLLLYLQPLLDPKPARPASARATPRSGRAPR